MPYLLHTRKHLFSGADQEASRSQDGQRKEMSSNHWTTRVPQTDNGLTYQIVRDEYWAWFQATFVVVNGRNNQAPQDTDAQNDFHHLSSEF